MGERVIRRLLPFDALSRSSEEMPSITIAKIPEMSMPWSVIFFFPAKPLWQSHLFAVVPRETYVDLLWKWLDLDDPSHLSGSQLQSQMDNGESPAKDGDRAGPAVVLVVVRRNAKSVPISSKTKPRCV